MNQDDCKTCETAALILEAEANITWRSNVSHETNRIEDSQARTRYETLKRVAKRLRAMIA